MAECPVSALIQTRHLDFSTFESQEVSRNSAVVVYQRWSRIWRTAGTLCELVLQELSAPICHKDREDGGLPQK